MLTTTLNQLSLYQKGEIQSLNITTALGRRLFDLGFVAQTIVECVGIAPLGNPHAYLIRGAIIALRNEDAAQIQVCLYKGGTP